MALVTSQICFSPVSNSTKDSFKIFTSFHQSGNCMLTEISVSIKYNRASLPHSKDKKNFIGFSHASLTEGKKQSQWYSTTATIVGSEREHQAKATFLPLYFPRIFHWFLPSQYIDSDLIWRFNWESYFFTICGHNEFYGANSRSISVYSKQLQGMRNLTAPSLRERSLTFSIFKAGEHIFSIHSHFFPHYVPPCLFTARSALPQKAKLCCLDPQMN